MNRCLSCQHAAAARDSQIRVVNSVEFFKSNFVVVIGEGQIAIFQSWIENMKALCLVCLPQLYGLGCLPW